MRSRRCTSLPLGFLPTCLQVALQAAAQQNHVPSLGSPAPASLLAARTGSRECPTDTGHSDPCASVSISHRLFTIGWDAQTRAITYIFTDDPRIVVDSELAVGGSCRILQEHGEPDPLVHYLAWIIDPRWGDTMHDRSGNALWHAALQRDPQHPNQDANIVGFVQSKYLKPAH